MSKWSVLLEEARDATDWVKYMRLARRAERLQEDVGTPDSHAPVRLALLGGSTTDLLERPLKLALTTCGLAPELLVTPFNQLHQELLDPESSTAQFEPDFAVVLPSLQNLLNWPDADASVADATLAAEHAVRGLLGPLENLHQRHGTEFVLANFLPPLRRPAGDLSATLPSNSTSFIRRINLLIADVAPPYVHLLDLAGMAERRGLERLVDVRLWHHAKVPVAPAFLPELARSIAAVIGAAVGKSKKVLVLDLDNTLWGGVIGDDGVEGIELGEGSAAGEAFKAIQQYVLSLKNRGVILAVASKNEDAAAREPFLHHPESVLHLEDFAAFKANWEPKSDNLRAIARELDLGLDSFVFLDDNPAERAEVASALPQVSVIQGPLDPVDMLDALDRSRLFETVAITTEDRQRHDLYRARGQASTLRTTARDLSGFLASLEMRGKVRPLVTADLERVTQLVNKTNQFNLTTRRMTRTEVDDVAAAEDCIHLTARLADQFGDHGLISVVMGRVEGGIVSIDNWLMSCRVLKRGVERLMLNALVAEADRRGVTELRGRYTPTDRNSLVSGHFEALGFELSDTEQDGTTLWRLPLAGFTPLDHFIASEDEGCPTTQSFGHDSSQSSATSSRKRASYSIRPPQRPTSTDGTHLRP